MPSHFFLYLCFSYVLVEAPTPYNDFSLVKKKNVSDSCLLEVDVTFSSLLIVDKEFVIY
jgi:hypothetical protein